MDEIECIIILSQIFVSSFGFSIIFHHYKNYLFWPCSYFIQFLCTSTSMNVAAFWLEIIPPTWIAKCIANMKTTSTTTWTWAWQRPCISLYTLTTLHTVRTFSLRKVSFFHNLIISILQPFLMLLWHNVKGRNNNSRSGTLSRTFILSLKMKHFLPFSPFFLIPSLKQTKSLRSMIMILLYVYVLVLQQVYCTATTRCFPYRWPSFYYFEGRKD